MLKNKFFLAALALLTFAIMYYTFFGKNDTSSTSIDPQVFSQQTNKARTQKDNLLKTGNDSPITDKANFHGLIYFAPDLMYRVDARLEPFADKTQKLVVRMTDGSEEVYEKFAHAVFSLDGKVNRLLVVKLQDTYSILFRDATSGKETYGGGRYVELSPSEMTDNHVIIDFNTAYNPYCAYNVTYACPLPPAENTLTIAIKAGEKYQEHP